MTIIDDIRRVETSGLRTWPAQQTQRFGGWQFGAAGGYSNRVNSANALSPSRAFADVLQTADLFYTQRRQPTIFRITPLAGDDADRRLDQEGFSRITPSLVMTADLVTPRAFSDVEIVDGFTDAWLDDVGRAKGLDAEASGQHRRILSRIPASTGYATLKIDGEAVGFGLIVVDPPFAGLFDIIVTPTCRGSGKGGRIVSALLAWAKHRGADKAFLQVHQANAAAVKLYEKYGFSTAYGYHYRLR